MPGAPFEVLLAAGAGKSVKLTYQSQGTSNPGGSGSSSFTFTQTLGAEDPNRYIVVAYEANDVCNSMTIGGIAATRIAGTGVVSIWMALVPTGTSASTVLSTGAVTGVAIEVYSLIASAPLSVNVDATSDTASTTSGSVNVPYNGCALAIARATSSTESFTGGLTQDAAGSSNAGAINVGFASAHGSFGTAQTPLTATLSATGEIVMAAWGPNDIVDQGQQYATFQSGTSAISGTTPTPTSTVIMVVCFAWIDTANPAPGISSCTICGHAATQVAQKINANRVTAIYAAVVNAGDPATYSTTGPAVSGSFVRTEVYKIDGFSRINTVSATATDGASVSATLNAPATSAVIANALATNASSPVWSGVTQDDVVSAGGVTNSISSAHANLIAANPSLTVTCSGLGGSGSTACFAVFSP